MVFLSIFILLLTQEINYTTMIIRKGRYSGFIRPIAYTLDILIISTLAFLCLFKDFTAAIIFIVYIVFSWSVSAVRVRFYEIYRNTSLVKVISKIVPQAVLLILITFAFFGLFRKYSGINNRDVIKYLIACILLITLVKIGIFYILKNYRKKFGGNYRTPAIIGRNQKTLQLRDFFNNNPDYGYRLTSIIDIKNSKLDISDYFQEFIENDVDEIYCSTVELNNKQIKSIVDFADNNLIGVKFIPDDKNIYTKRLKYENYGVLPILSLRNIPLTDSINRAIKRTFDVVFSSLVIIFVLSWLTPIIGLLIKIESKGPVFFKQYRTGHNNIKFLCYKFRSMTQNKDAHLKQATKNDMRVTRVGKFIRKTSIDELPQFFNVFFGDMSVVGPRPHMISHTEMYAKKVHKFMVRHFVKPGITGLAQVKGYRGEIETDNDIINRVKFDIFYAENWSLIMDIKIIVQTILNAIKGEEKAY